MRVCQGTIEIAGQMGILSGGLKRKGFIAVGYNTFHSYLGYQDHLINTIPSKIANTHQQIIKFFDLFHFHYNSSLLPEFSDLPLIKERGKKMIMHHWGNDVRFHDKARLNNPYVFTGDSPANEVIHERLSCISKYISEAIVQDHEVLSYVQPYYKKVHVLPIAIYLKRFRPAYPTLSTKKPLIIHAPTNPDFKGTRYIEDAIRQLQHTHEFEYRRIEKMNHQQASILYRKADIIVDQILCGSYGLFSVEAMALGKPVLTYIRPDLLPKFSPELPIINSNPDNIYTQLKLLLDQPDLRYQLGVQGRQYVEKYHDIKKLIEPLINIYKQLGE